MFCICRGGGGSIFGCQKGMEVLLGITWQRPGTVDILLWAGGKSCLLRTLLYSIKIFFNVKTYYLRLDPNSVVHTNMYKNGPCAVLMQVDFFKKQLPCISREDYTCVVQDFTKSCSSFQWNTDDYAAPGTGNTVTTPLGPSAFVAVTFTLQASDYFIMSASAVMPGNVCFEVLYYKVLSFNGSFTWQLG